jgi:hypothetical protein
MVAHWFDAGVVADAQKTAGSTYDTGSLMNVLVLARLLTAVGVVAVVAAGWWARSRIVGIGYVVVGGFVATLPATVWAFAMHINDRPPVLPDPIARTMTDWWSSLETGVTGAVYTIGAVMLVVGLAVIGSNLVSMRTRLGQAPSAALAPQPSPETPLT